MRMSRIMAPLLAAAVMQLLPTAVGAQGFYTLPKDDFIWRWGDVAEGQEQRGMADIELSGSESFFQCDLTARLRVSSARTQSETRDLEMQLRQRLDFIYAASEYMNYLEQTRELQWATLDCKRQGDDENASPEERANRESAARDKMLRELERRRERQQRNND
jgi:hypothetical protein